MRLPGNGEIVGDGWWNLFGIAGTISGTGGWVLSDFLILPHPFPFISTIFGSGTSILYLENRHHVFRSFRLPSSSEASRLSLFPMQFEED